MAGTQLKRRSLSGSHKMDEPAYDKIFIIRRCKMKLITKEIESKMPAIGSQNEENNPIVHVKFFTPDANWTWYALEYDPEERIFFGFVDGMFPELGLFTLEELESVRGPFGLPVERDLYWEPKGLQEVMAGAL